MPDRNPIVTYQVEIPMDQAGEIGSILNERGIEFDPRWNIITRNDAGPQTQECSGLRAGEIIQEINQYLDGRKLRPRLPEDLENLTVLQAHELLELAVEQFDHEEKRFIEDQRDAQTVWAEIVPHYPNLFEKNPGERPGSQGRAGRDEAVREIARQEAHGLLQRAVQQMWELSNHEGDPGVRRAVSTAANAIDDVLNNRDI